MNWKTKERTVTNIVGHDADELSEFMNMRMFPARVRPHGGGRGLFFRIGAYYYDLFFEAELPSGAVLNKLEGAGLDSYCLYIPLEGSIASKSGSKQVLSTPRVAAFGESPAFSEHVHSAGSRFVVLGIDRGEMVRHLSDLIERPVVRPFEFASSLDLATDAGLGIMAVTLALQAGLGGTAPLLQSPIAMKRLKETTIALLLEGVPHRFSEELRSPVTAASPYYVKRAIEFMWANASRPISAAEIASECGVSVRALNSGFRGFKAKPMMAYLREIRLSGARQELRNPGVVASIAAIAQKWGFTHFGRFSSEYLKRFGELPSQTRRRTVGAGLGPL